MGDKWIKINHEFSSRQELKGKYVRTCCREFGREKGGKGSSEGVRKSWTDEGNREESWQCSEQEKALARVVFQITYPWCQSASREGRGLFEKSSKGAVMMA